MGATAALLSLSAGQTYSQYQTARAQGEYQKGIADTNQRFANLRAEDALRRGEEDAGTVRRQTRRLVGSQRAAFAGQGVEVDSGSAAEVQDDTRTLGALDELTVRNNAWREAWGHRADALDSASQGRFASLAARNQARNTILTGGLQFAAYGAQGIQRNRERR